MTRAFSSNLRGKVRNFSLPKNRPLVPLYEAIVNSINAIDERAKKLGAFRGKVEIEVIRERTIFAESDKHTVKGFCVHDNGIGFDEANMASFMEADSEYKMAIGGKGVGRFSWLKAFSNVQVVSTYKEDNGFVTREFIFSLNHLDIDDVLKEATNESEYHTMVKLIDYIKDYEKEVPKQLSTIATRIIQHCFVYFLSDSCPEIQIYDEEERISLNKIFKEQFSTDNNKSTFIVGEHVFHLLSIKINDRAFPHKNRLYLCANERLVDSKDLERIIVDLDSEIFEQEGYWYLGILTSNYLDENVDMNRLSFSIPQESSALLPNVPGLDDIVKSAATIVQTYLRDYLNGVGERKQERIQRYTMDVAPQYRHLEHYVPERIAALKPGLSNEELDDALYGIKRDFENQTKVECTNLMKKLEKGDISSEEYQRQFQETIGRVSDVNRAALAEYVIHRRIILNLFAHGLDIKDDGKFNLEKYMHQLIYPMRSTSDDMPYENHNLWLLDEKLSFCQYISSDKPFDNVQGEDRADILILDSPVVVAENKNTGTTYDAITIFELKRPARDNYNMEDNPITQLMDYAKKIKDDKAKDSRHRPIHASETTQFYLYAVCDITPTLARVLERMSFTRTPDNLGAYFYNRELHAYIEVLSYDKIRNDSEKRNRVLFDKLGILE
ncbi:MAG: ATP-binding protein [Bacteroidaceae bacterium]|nr:ATP-binding protein [Lachnospiraceae bacterium]MBR4794042.1 ATP-binding protein [Bacteroidaceae bacterium]